METLSPPASISPPLHATLPHTYALPPIPTNLPTWNRNKFKDCKVLRHVPTNPQNNDNQEEEQIVSRVEETCTQTSNSGSRSSSKSSLCGEGGREKEKRLLEKKIVFLESNHNEVLTRLHRELERTKRDNKALKFQLVMGNKNLEGGAVVSTNDDNASEVTETKCVDEDTIENVERSMENNLLKDEIKELKSLLDEAHTENTQLKKVTEEIKQRSQYFESAVHQQKLNESCPPGVRNQSVFIATDGKRSCKKNPKALDLVEVSFAFESVWKKLQERQGFISDSHHQGAPKHILLPKLEHKNNKLISLDHNSPYKQNRKVPEPISLPLLHAPAAVPENRNISLRQKRAKALHVQRQRSACKDVCIASAEVVDDGS